ncbi:trypsin-like serine peptidase [Porcipelethomonas sp.]|uniref:trypsin-like serine peptidase n=1 Tax=Porcipelethomonas sp. TaxID=2981675 RepID=UPI003EF13328
MIMINKKTKITAILTFVVMTLGVIFGGYNMYEANADIAGTTYLKYTYATGTTTEYTLPSIPEVDISNYAAVAALSDEDNRADAPLEQTIVSIKYFVPTETPGIYSMPIGTGFIIGDHEIMTAAHMVNNSGNFFTSPVIEIPNSNPQNDNGTTVTPIATHVAKKQIQGDPGYDYAIITVEEDLSAYGKALLGMPTESAISNNMNIHCLGYANYNNTNLVLKISNGTILDSIDGLELTTSADTAGGTSGGPIYVETDYGNSDGSNMKTYKTVIGICSGLKYGNEIGPIVRPTVLQFAYNNPNL